MLNNKTRLPTLFYTQFFLVILAYICSHVIIYSKVVYSCASAEKLEVGSLT